LNFLIITHAEHFIHSNGDVFAYAPYVTEMNLWLKYVDKVTIVAPKGNHFDQNINSKYIHPNIKCIEVESFSLTSFNNGIEAIITIPFIFRTVYKAMKSAGHIHLRCPGNMGLIGCVAQILFPKKKKTAKYAGNWDYNSKQPWSYRLQQYILNNTMLTKTMTALVYGEWAGISKNIKPFYTASYFNDEIEQLFVRNYTKTLHFCFVGSLTENKGVFEALQIASQLKSTGKDVVLHYYGDGEKRKDLEAQITGINAQNWAFVYGNQPKIQLKKAFKYSHFLILPSRSEGWPKAVAEAMFWGCIPIVTEVSCVPWMLGHGKRGLLLQKPIEQNHESIQKCIANPKGLVEMSQAAAEWSRQYTLDKFEKDVSYLV